MYKVFFVDDEPYIIEGLNLLMDWNAMGIEIIGSADNGTDALEKIKELKPDIVVTDIHLPGIDGLELIKECASLPGNCPEFLLLTGYGELEYIKKAMRLGARGYLLKPINPDELSEYIELILCDFSKRDDANSENDELISYVASDTFMRIIYGECSEKLIRRAEFLLGAERGAELSLMLFGLPQNSSFAETRRFIDIIRSLDGVDPECVFDMGFSFAAYVSRAMTTEESTSLAQRVADVCENLIEAIIVLPPGSPELWCDKISHVLVERQAGVYKNKIFDYSRINNADYDSDIEMDAEQILELARNGDYDAAERELKSVFFAMERAGMQTRRLRGFATLFMFGLYKYIQRIGLDCEGLFNSASFRITRALHAYEMFTVCSELLEQVEKLIMKGKYVSEFESVMDYIEKNYKKNITLADIGRAIYIKSAVISKIVKNATGMKFSDYLNKLRMQEACRLISKTDMTIACVASEVGYSDYAYFANKFKQYSNCLPSQYRKRVRHMK